MRFKTKIATAASAAVSAGVAAAILIPTAATNAGPLPAVAAPEQLPIAALQSAPSLPTDVKTKDALATATSAMGVELSSLRLAARGVWVTRRANGEVCLLAPNSQGLGAGCWSEAGAKVGDASLESRDDNGVVTRVGLVPDGYSTAVARTDGGTAVTKTSIDGNVYRLSGKGIAAIEFTGTDGKPTLEAEVDR